MVTVPARAARSDSLAVPFLPVRRAEPFTPAPDALTFAPRTAWPRPSRTVTFTPPLRPCRSDPFAFTTRLGPRRSVLTVQPPTLPPSSTIATRQYSALRDA